LIALLLWCAALQADDFARGLELARSREIAPARAAFTAGFVKAPQDKRYPLELAGLAYLEKDFTGAKRYLRRALRLDPRDEYGNDFLATLYFLDRNYEAALAYWNRVSKPYIRTTAIEAGASRLLAERALTFSPSGLLTLENYRQSKTRLDALDLFPFHGVEFQAEPEEAFSVRVSARERSRKWALLGGLGGLPFQTVHADLDNLDGAGLNFRSLARWDAQKRRAAFSLAAPLRGQPEWRYRFFAEGRSETWNTGASLGAEDFRLQKTEAGGEIRAIQSHRFSWSSGLRVSWHGLANLTGWEEGAALTYRAAAEADLLHMPERRLQVRSSAAWELGRMFTGSRALFSRFESGVHVSWLPQARGEDYAVNARFRAGRSLGRIPFDELYVLGAERDTDLELRGHSGTRFGKKGHAPLARDFLLWNLDLAKTVYGHPLFRVQLGPFVDIARAWPNANGWMLDPGVQLRLRLPGGVGFRLSYGRNLRTGQGAFLARRGL
jgi:tetratricopeptide (TPR) repeat protein